MARVDVDFEGTAGSALVAPSADAQSLGTAGGSTYTYSSTHALHGSTSLMVTPVAGQSRQDLLKTGLNASQIGLSGAFWYDAVATQDELIFGLYDASLSPVFRLTRAGSGKLSLLDKNGTTTRLWIGTANPPTSQWIYAKLWCQIGGTATTGSVKAAFYTNLTGTVLAGASGGLDTPFSATGTVNLGTANIDRIYIGDPGTPSSTGARWFDTVSYDTAATDLLTNFGLTAPTGAATLADNLARITITPSGGTAPYTFQITQPGGPAVTPAPDGTGSWLIAKDAVSDLTYSITVTDNVGTVSAPISVLVPHISAQAGTLRYFDGVNTYSL